MIVNASDIAESLHRPPSHFTKFFGCELGAQSKWTEETDRAVVNGAHATAEMQSLVDKYCDLFVLCPTCTYPETRLKVKSKKKENDGKIRKTKTERTDPTGRRVFDNGCPPPFIIK